MDKNDLVYFLNNLINESVYHGADGIGCMGMGNPKGIKKAIEDILTYLDLNDEYTIRYRADYVDQADAGHESDYYIGKKLSSSEIEF